MNIVAYQVSLRDLNANRENPHNLPLEATVCVGLEKRNAPNSPSSLCKLVARDIGLRQTVECTANSP